MISGHFAKPTKFCFSFILLTELEGFMRCHLQNNKATEEFTNQLMKEIKELTNVMLQ